MRGLDADNDHATVIADLDVAVDRRSGATTAGWIRWT
jgi:hypothetical protein